MSYFTNAYKSKLNMITEFSLTILIIVIFVAVLLLQLKVLNTVAKRQYNIAEQMKEDEGKQDLHKPGPKVEA
ncbi:MAG TPA: hypothetical protein VK004_06360 [Ignavibacteria bacterium]|nr:hypothetical protein [Ignavibacteria bacterium]